MADGTHGHRGEAGMSKPRVLSLFSGIGGFDLGLERAGFEVVAQCDNDPFCNKVLAHHWPGVKRYDDIRLISYEGLQTLPNREAVGSVPSPTEGSAGAALMVRPVLQRVLQGTTPAGQSGTAAPLEYEPSLWPDTDGAERATPGAAQPLCDLSAADGEDEGGPRPRDGRGSRPIVPSLQPASGRGGECGVSNERSGLPPCGPPPFVDLIVGGFPCQDLSVAGLRRGLEAERSGLFFEFMRIVREMREASNGRFPTAVIAENVPGLFSSASGRDFGVVLNALAECGAVDVGWRVIDSQHWVPQRRRRVFIVALFPPATSGRFGDGGSSQILSLCEGGDWHPQKGREAREDVAGTLKGSSRDSGTDNSAESADRLILANTMGAHAPRYDLDNETYIPTLAGTLGQDLGHHGGATTLDGHGAYIAHTLSADGFDVSEDGTGRGTPIVSVRTAQAGSNGRGVDESGTAYTLDGANGQAVMANLETIQSASVRRLTPKECARLQGFPDDWLDLPGASDGAKYKALGNAVTVPVIEYLGVRLREVLS